MRDYAKLQPTFWMRGSGKKLRGHPEAQIVALYLFSAPTSSMLGLFYCPITTIAHETGLTIEGASKGLAKVSQEGIAHYDPEDELVFLPAGLRVSVGDGLQAGDKRVIGLNRELAQFGNHKFVRALLSAYGRSHHLKVEGLRASPLEGPSQGPSEPLRSQEQEQEKDQEEDQEQVMERARDAPERQHQQQPSLSGRWILNELARHPSLADVANREFASALLGRLQGKPKPLELVARAIAEAAVDVAGHGMNREAVAKKVRVYVENAADRRPLSRASPGPSRVQPGEGRAWTSNPKEV
jgi:hypothetical protein